MADRQIIFNSMEELLNNLFERTSKDEIGVFFDEQLFSFTIDVSESIDIRDITSGLVNIHGKNYLISDTSGLFNDSLTDEPTNTHIMLMCLDELNKFLNSPNKGESHEVHRTGVKKFDDYLLLVMI